jgi:glycosyltransferase involved in cell wall biosynthesis
VRIVNYHPRARVGDGGITNSVRELSLAFARAGAVPVIAYDGMGDPSVEAGVEWWPVRHVGRGVGRVGVDLRAALVGADVLVLNSAWTGGNAAAGAAARRLDVPYVLAPRGAYDPGIVGRRRVSKRVWWTLVERRLVRDATAIHVFFEEQCAHLQHLGYEGAFVVAPNGVRVPPDRRWDGGTGGYLAYLGRFDPEHKGLDLLVQAMALLPADERPQLRLHGPDWRGGKDRVRDLVRDLDLARDVVLGPPLYGEEKWTLLERAVGFVYPSRWEGFGNSLAEAAALGVPTLATPYPLAAYLAERDGCVVVAADPPSLAEGLRLLGTAGAVQPPTTVAQALGWDTVAHEWLAQLATLCQREGARRGRRVGR